MEDKEDDEDQLAGVANKEVITDTACSPQFSQRLHAILGPRGVHNPEVAKKLDGKTDNETRLLFGPDFYDIDNGATWTLFGVVGPAEKVLEYAARCA